MGDTLSDDVIRSAPQRRRGVRADRDKLVAALMRSELKRKTQAAIAERIADLEELDTIPRDLVSRVFREQTVDAPSIARVAAALGVDPLTLHKVDARTDASSLEEEPDQEEIAPESSASKTAPPRAGLPRLLTWAALALMLVVGTVGLTSLVLSAQLQAQAGQRTLHGFYAEIGDVYRHYLYSQEELVADPADRNFDLQLGLAQYGELAFTRAEIARTGMRPEEIRRSMELLLLVRNNDLRIAEIRSGDSAEGDLRRQQVETLRSRMKDTRDVAYAILTALHRQLSISSDLPPVPEGYQPSG